MDSSSKTLKATALSIAVSQLNVRETKGKPNSGPQVDQYLKSVGLGSGYSWCMAFVYWCYNEAAKSLNVKQPLIKTGGVLHQWNAQQSRFKILPQTASTSPSLIKPGSIFIMDFGKGMGHTGLVESFDGKLIHTIEGNSNDEGSREGLEVCRKPGGRKLSSIKGFLVI